MIHLPKFRFVILAVLLAGGLCAGCVSASLEKFNRQVQEWVPLGTSVADAERIMGQHGFECSLLTRDHPFNAYGVDYLDCDKEQVRLHDWNVKLFLKDGKVSRYGPMSVDEHSL